jgi:hypothetical protein
VTDGDFLAALVDCIAPGGLVTKVVVLPSASAAGCDDALAEALKGNSDLQALVDAIAVRAGGGASFCASPAQERETLLEAVQKQQPEAFAQMVTLTLARYYAHPQVLEALDWPARPPQPEGHKLPAFDGTLLTPVLARGALWRQC